jgi:hypothetical protein
VAAVHQQVLMVQQQVLLARPFVQAVQLVAAVQVHRLRLERGLWRS